MVDFTFDIVINDILLNIDSINPNFNGNENLLTLINDFEDEKWRLDKFHDYIWNNIWETALSSKERSALLGNPFNYLKESSKKLRLIDNDKVWEWSEIAEILLYWIIKEHYKWLPVVPKIFYKQNVNDNAKWADSVHIVINDEMTDFSLWLWESKFFNSIEDSRFYNVIDSVCNWLKTEKFKKENSIITSSSDLKELIPNNDLYQEIKKVLDWKTSIDLIKPKLHVPILLLHECSITSWEKFLTDEYRNKIEDYHRERAISYFEKLNKKLISEITLFDKVTFHLILFPVPSKEEIVEKFTSTASHFRS